MNTNVKMDPIDIMKNKWVWNPEIRSSFEETDNICNAVYQMNMNELNEIVKVNGINAKTLFDLSLLHLACKYENLELVKFLIENGADNISRDNNDRTPLFYTIHHKNTEIIEELKLSQTYFKLRDKFGFKASNYVNISNTKIFCFLEPKMIRSLTFFYCRCGSSCIRFTNYLFKLNNDNIKQIDELHLILYAINDKIGTFVADVVKDFIDVISVDENGFTILHKIFMNYQVKWDNDAIKCLLEECINKGANINAITKDGLSLSRILIEKGMPIQTLANIHEHSFYGWPNDNLQQTDLQHTIITKETSNKYDKYFSWLLKNWPQYQSTDHNGNTCLHLAAKHTPDIEFKNENWKSSYIIKILQTCEHRLLYIKNNYLLLAADLALHGGKPNMAQLLKELMNEDFAICDKRGAKLNDEFIFTHYFPLYWMDRNDGVYEYMNEIHYENALTKLNECHFGRINLHYAIQKESLEQFVNLYNQNRKGFLKRDTFGNTPFAFSGMKENYIKLWENIENECGAATLHILQSETSQFKKEYESYKKFSEYCIDRKLKNTSAAEIMMVLSRWFKEEIFTNLYTKIGINIDRTGSSETPLQVAVEIYDEDWSEGWLKLAKKLIDIGDNIYVKTNTGGTLLHLASSHKYSRKLYRFLISYALDINACDNEGFTAIHKLIQQQGDYSSLSILYINANIEIVTKTGDNYLHCSVNNLPDGMENNSDAVSLIFNTNLIKPNQYGKTPFHLASELGKNQTFYSLLKIDLNNLVFFRDNNDKTALDYAAENDHSEIILNAIQKHFMMTDSDLIELCFNLNGQNNEIANISCTGHYHKFLENDKLLIKTNYDAKTLLKLFQEFTASGVVIDPEIEFNIQKAILDSELTVKDKDNNALIKQFPNVDKIKEQVEFLIGLIRENITKLNTHEITFELLQEILQIAINLRQLKNKIGRYIELPWREMEFILVSFLTIYSRQKGIDSFVYKVLLNKQRIKMHLTAFVDKLDVVKTSITNDLFSPKQLQPLSDIIKNISDETQLLQDLIQKTKTFKELNKIQSKMAELKKIIDESIKTGSSKKDVKETTEFKDLINDFQAARTFYSLSKILHYVDQSVTVDIKKNELGILVIQRTMQVFGEYIKNSTDSPNVSQKIHNAISSRTKYLKDCLINIRNDLSHVDYMKSTLDIESNIELYTNIQNDLRYLRPMIINLLFDEREECIRKIFRKMFNSKTNSDLDQLCFNLIPQTNVLQFDHFMKLKILVQNLKDIIVFKTKDEENIFHKIDNIIQNKSLDSILGFNFGNPDTFLLNTEDETSLGQTKEFLRFEGPKKIHEPFQLIAFFTLQIQKMAQDRFLQKFNEIQNICNEILYTSVIGVKEKIYEKIKHQNTKEYQIELTKDIKYNLDDFIGRIQVSEVKLAFKSELEGFLNINAIFNKLKEFVLITNKTNEQTEELNQVLSEYEKFFGKPINKLKSDSKFVEKMQNLQDKYFIFFDNCLKEKSLIKPLNKFLKLFKCLTKNKNKELRKCFNDRMEKLERILPDEKKYIQHLRQPDSCLKMAVEVIVLNLYEMLEEIGMIETDGEILACSLPLISAKDLRNYLAHGDALFDILPFKSEISVFANGFKLINLVRNSQFDIFSDNKIINYSFKFNSSNTSEERNTLQMELIRSENNIICKARKCHPIGSLWYFYKVPILRGIDPQGRTLFNLIFESDPKATIKFFMDNKYKIIINTKSIKSLHELLQNINDDLNTMDLNNFSQYLINQLFAANERHDVITLMIKICALNGYQEEIDEICTMSDDNFYESFLKMNYNTLMNFSDQYSYVINIKKYSRLHIPEYDNEFSLMHLAAAFNHSYVVKKLLKQGHNVNVTARNMKTPLHVATQCGYIEMIDLLISNGADINAETLDGRSYHNGKSQSNNCV